MICWYMKPTKQHPLGVLVGLCLLLVEMICCGPNALRALATWSQSKLFEPGG